MANQNKKPIAKCMQMCPTIECIKREKENLVHILESSNSANDKPKNRKIDRTKMIKCYSRSAAGQILLKPELLRPPSVLLETVNYIFKKVINDNRVSKSKLYDFINDRLRSVKQDAVVQRLDSEYWLRLLPPVIRFYVYSSYWFCDEPATKFDSTLNKNQLLDCLIHFITAYQTFAYENCTDVLAEMEAFYLILNLNDREIINRAVQLNLPEHVFQSTLKLILKYHQHNWCTIFRNLLNLPLLPACLIVALHLSKLRKNTLQNMSFAYSSKSVNYPVDKLRTDLLFNSIEETIAECLFYNITVNSEGNMVQFTKTVFKDDKATIKKLKSIDENLSAIPISSLLLNNVSNR